MTDVYGLVLVTALDINDTQFLYPSCDKCYSKLSEDIDLRWICLKCDLTYAKEKVTWRFRISLRVSDASAVCNVCVFGATLDQYFGDNAHKFHRNLMKLIKEQNNAEELVLEAAQEVFVGNSFYLGIKSPVCYGVRPVSLTEIVNHNFDYRFDSPTSTQEVDKPSLVANQIIPVVGKCKTNVSNIIRSVLKQDNSCVKSCVSLKKTFLSYGSLVSENLTQEETSGLSTFSQPTIVLSCDLTQSQNYEDSKVIDEHASIRNFKPDQDETMGPTSSKKSAGDLEFNLQSEKKNDLLLPPDGTNDLDHQQHYLNDKQARPPERGDVELNICDEKENLFPVEQKDSDTREDMELVADTTSYDLFDSTEFESPNSCDIHPFSENRKLAKQTSENPKHVFSAQVNTLNENKHFPNHEVRNHSVFSQEIFTPSPIFNIRSAASSKHDKWKSPSSSKYLVLLRKKLKSLPNIPPDKSDDGGKYDQVYIYSPGERESPLLFSDTSCDHSVTTASPAHNDFNKSSDCISPDIFESTPKQITLKKSWLSPYLVKNLFKD